LGGHGERLRAGHAGPVKEVDRVGRIVVGVDASPDARRALAWAAAEARVRQARLQVVHAYRSHELAVPVYFPSQHAVPSVTIADTEALSQAEMNTAVQDRAEVAEAFRGQAEQLLDVLLTELDETVSGVDVQRTVEEGRHPAEVLLELSSDADLLVVGSRGHGGFGDLQLGSVSHACVLHAVCPVVVVPAQHRRRRAGTGQAFNPEPPGGRGAGSGSTPD
jgi:nucleotide-binding universal stress UspA family protein